MTLNAAEKQTRAQMVQRLQYARGMPEDLVLLSHAEVAVVLGVSARKVARMITQNEIPGSWTPEGQRVSLLDLRRYLAGEFRSLTVAEAAARLGMSDSAVRSAMQAGRLVRAANTTPVRVTAFSVENLVRGKPVSTQLEDMTRAGWWGAPVHSWPEPGPWPIAAEPTVHGPGQWQHDVWAGIVRLLSRAMAGELRKVMVRLPYGALAIQTNPESEKHFAAAVKRAGGDTLVRGFTPNIETVESPKNTWRLMRLPDDVDPKTLLPALPVEPVRGVKIHHQNYGFIPMPLLPGVAQDGDVTMRDARGGFEPLLLGDVPVNRLPEVPETWLGVLLQTLGI